MRDFYLTLPSNTADANNTSSSYRVNLPTRMNLQGEWEVGLSEILYPNTWTNIFGGEGWFSVDGMKQPGMEVILPPKKYTHITELIGAMNESIEPLHSGDDRPQLRFDYNSSVHRVVVVKSGTPGLRCTLSKRLQYILGFDTDLIVNGELSHFHRKAKYAPDLNAGFTSLFVYCNLISPQIVGDTNAQVIRVVNIQNAEFGANMEKEYTNPHYVPLLSKDFSSVEIDIKDDRSNLVLFEYGKITVKLHFRKRRLV